jgi:hypothetical protein
MFHTHTKQRAKYAAADDDNNSNNNLVENFGYVKYYVSYLIIYW